LLGDIIPSSNKSNLPEWIDEERTQDVANLRESLPSLYTTLDVSNNQWRSFVRAAKCEQSLPESVKPLLTPLQCVLIVKVFRPDRLHVVMEEFTCRLLKIKALTPGKSKLSEVSTKD